MPITGASASNRSWTAFEVRPALEPTTLPSEPWSAAATLSLAHAASVRSATLKALAARRRGRVGARGYLSASAPAVAVNSSFAEATPDTPIAPTTLPPETIGMPPSSGVMSRTLK